MPKNTNWTAKDLRDKKLIIVDDHKVVKAGSLVAKKVEKINIPVNFMTRFDTTTPEEAYKVFKELGIVFRPPTDSFTLPNGEAVYPKYRFDIVPCPAPRLTRRDAIFLDPEHKDPAKRQRACVTRYFAFKREFMRQASLNGFTLGETLRVVFILPMPKTWSKAKRVANLNQPHRQKPDADNLFKAAADALGEDDSHIWDFRAVKIWGEKGAIIIF